MVATAVHLVVHFRRPDGHRPADARDWTPGAAAATAAAATAGARGRVRPAPVADPRRWRADRRSRREAAGVLDVEHAEHSARVRRPRRLRSGIVVARGGGQHAGLARFAPPDEEERRTAGQPVDGPHVGERRVAQPGRGRRPRSAAARRRRLQGSRRAALGSGRRQRGIVRRRESIVAAVGQEATRPVRDADFRVGAERTCRSPAVPQAAAATVGGRRALEGRARRRRRKRSRLVVVSVLQVPSRRGGRRRSPVRPLEAEDRHRGYARRAAGDHLQRTPGSRLVRGSLIGLWLDGAF